MATTQKPAAAVTTPRTFEKFTSERLATVTRAPRGNARYNRAPRDVSRFLGADAASVDDSVESKSIALPKVFRDPQDPGLTKRYLTKVLGKDKQGQPIINEIGWINEIGSSRLTMFPKRVELRAIRGRTWGGPQDAFYVYDTDADCFACAKPHTVSFDAAFGLTPAPSDGRSFYATYLVQSAAYLPGRVNSTGRGTGYTLVTHVKGVDLVTGSPFDLGMCRLFGPQQIMDTVHALCSPVSPTSAMARELIGNRLPQDNADLDWLGAHFYWERNNQLPTALHYAISGIMNVTNAYEHTDPESGRLLREGLLLAKTELFDDLEGFKAYRAKMEGLRVEQAPQQQQSEVVDEDAPF